LEAFRGQVAFFALDHPKQGQQSRALLGIPRSDSLELIEEFFGEDPAHKSPLDVLAPSLAFAEGISSAALVCFT